LKLAQSRSKPKVKVSAPGSELTMKDIYSANNCVISDEQSEQQFLNSIKLLEVELAKLNDE
jgi:hypothetical protein